LFGEFEMVYGTGEFREWHDNGHLKALICFHAGELHGANESYDLTGKKSLSTYYLHGKKVSKKAFESAEKTQ
jgi:antitoxin component YwqK of YwqJK toxin-antitoxin module